MSLAVVEPGLVEYGAALELQRRLWNEVRQDPSRAYLILLEHPPVFTLGRRGDPANILDPRGIPVVRTDRGGDATYHGPGQLVGYPILSLRARRIGVRDLVERLEEAIIEGLADLGIAAARKPGCVGIWARGAKIASLGLRVERGVSRHGFALNVANSLEPFAWINPCGLPACPVTSVSRELGRAAPVPDAAAAVLRRFCRLFRLSPAPVRA